MTYRATTHLPQFHRRAPMKEPCRVATTGNITIATALQPGQVIDGVTLAAGDRVLVWQQTDATENGIWIVGTTPVRSYDMDNEDEVPGVMVTVLAGATYSGSPFVNQNTGPILFGTTDITFLLLPTSTTVSSALVPTYVAPGVTWSLPANSQAVWTVPIVLDVGAGISIGTNSALVEVH